MRRLALLLFLALALLASAACSESKDDPLADKAGSEGDDASDDIDASDDGDDDDPAGVTIELLDAGAEPRRELRLQPPDDCTIPITQRQRQEIQISFGEAEQTTSSATEQDVTYSCAAVTEDRIEVRTEYGEGRVTEGDEASRELVQDTLEAFDGTEGLVVYDHQGRILDFQAPEVDLPGELADMGDSLIEGLESQGTNLASPLPDEAIGVGARWTVTSAGNLSGLSYQQISTFTLTALDGDDVAADLEVTLEFFPGPMEVPGVANADAEVVDGALAGTGTIAWNLRQPVPLTSQTLNGTLTLRLGTGSDATEIVQQQALESSIVAR
jgi:hypothetical protein